MFHINVKPYQKAIVKFRQPAYSNVFQQTRRMARVLSWLAEIEFYGWLMKCIHYVFIFGRNAFPAD